MDVPVNGLRVKRSYSLRLTRKLVVDTRGARLRSRGHYLSGPKRTGVLARESRVPKVLKLQASAICPARHVRHYLLKSMPPLLLRNVEIHKLANNSQSNLRRLLRRLRDLEEHEKERFTACQSRSVWL